MKRFLLALSVLSLFGFLGACATHRLVPPKTELNAADLKELVSAFEAVIAKKVAAAGGTLKESQITNFEQNPERADKVRIAYRVVYEIPKKEGDPPAQITYAAVSLLQADEVVATQRKWKVIETFQTSYVIEFIEPTSADEARTP